MYMENFNKTVNYILENQQYKHMFILIDPSEYQSAIVTDTWISQQRASVPNYEYFKVMMPNEEGENLQRTKYKRTTELPEEIDSTWLKTPIMYGGDVMKYTDKDTRGNPVRQYSNYIVLNPHQYSDRELFTAYLEPALEPELRDVFGDLYSEL